MIWTAGNMLKMFRAWSYRTGRSRLAYKVTKVDKLKTIAEGVENLAAAHHQ